MIWCLLFGFNLVVGLFRIIICGFIVKMEIMVIFFICFFDIWNGEDDIIFFEKFNLRRSWKVLFLIFFRFILKFLGLNLIFFLMLFLNNWDFGNWNIIFIFFFMWCKCLFLVLFVIFKLLMLIEFVVGFNKVFKCWIRVDFLFLVWLIIV